MKTKPKFVTKLFAVIDGYYEAKAQNVDLSKTACEIVKPFIENNNGVWMYERDGKIYSNFTGQEDAVNCGVVIQQALQSEPELKLRIGIHTGDVTSGFGTGDIVASGISATAVPGGICISDKVYAAIQNKTDVKAEFIEEAKLDNIDRPVRVYALVGEGLAEPVAKSSILKAKPSIAVLPFVNMSADPEQEYFCDGITEEIINALTHVESLHVVARTSAFAFKGKDDDVTEIGRQLRVASLLEGSVRKTGNRLRISAQLVNVADGYHLWSDAYNRELEDVFAIQEEISLAIVEALEVKLLKKEKAAIVKRYTEDMEAYNLYLKGNYYWQMLTKEGFDKAIECYEQALKKDPHYALVYTGLASVYWMISYWGNVPPNEAYPKAKEYVKKALEIDNNLIEAHATLGIINTNYDWNWKAAEREFKKALQLNPNSALTHIQYSFLLTFTERHEEAISEAKRAQELDPLSSYINSLVGIVFLFGGRNDEAIEVLRMTITMNPNYFLAHLILGQSYRVKSIFEEAIAEFEKAVELSCENPKVVTFLATTYYESGKKTKTEKLFDSLNQRQRDEYVPPVCFYQINQVRGDHDKAFEWLERACYEHDSFLPWLRVHPIESARIPDEPRFKALMKKAGLE